jgi:pimeloyl-ACP methyl ester carboxylesterase
MSLPGICAVWKVPAAKPLENKPVGSDIPTFVIGAEYDAYTPPAWGKSVAANLKNSFFVEIPWAGHGPSFSTPCLRDLIAEFIDKPETAPDSSVCVEKVRRQFGFVVPKS